MEKLIEEAQKGNEEAFTKIIIDLEKDLYKMARARFNSEDDICEVVQETIIAAFNNMKKLKKPEYFKTWIIKILINNCNKMYKKKRKKDLFEYDEKILEDTYSKNEYEIVIDKLDFEGLIKNLKYNERITLILYYMENLTTKEIGKLLKEPESTIRNRISRAKLKLKKELEKRS